MLQLFNDWGYYNMFLIILYNFKKAKVKQKD